MRAFRRVFLLVSLYLFGFAGFAVAQGDSELSLRMSRNFGYSSGTGKIQGNFTLKASGPDDLARVVFYIDDQVIGEASEAPFNLKFQTEDYGQGVHTLYALGYRTDGREMRSNEIKAEFVTFEEGWQAGMKILGPILVLTFGVIAFSFVFTMVTSRKQKNLPPGTPRNYGAAGGAICPRCERPYTRHFLSPNLLVGKLERCPFCGKWAVVAARPLGELRAAEAAELEGARDEGETPAISEEEKLRRDLDASRYQDL